MEVVHSKKYKNISMYDKNNLLHVLLAASTWEVVTAKLQQGSERHCAKSHQQASKKKKLSLQMYTSLPGE